MTFDTWIFMATLLAIGVKMVMDPEGSARFPYEIADAILDRSLDSRITLSSNGRTAIRVAGAAVIVLAMAIVAVS